jgi:hypothetical protein
MFLFDGEGKLAPESLMVVVPESGLPMDEIMTGKTNDS